MQFGASMRTYTLQLGQPGAAAAAVATASSTDAAAVTEAAVEREAAPPPKKKRARVKFADDSDDDCTGAAAAAGAAAAEQGFQQAKRNNLEQVMMVQGAGFQGAKAVRRSCWCMPPNMPRLYVALQRLLFNHQLNFVGLAHAFCMRHDECLPLH
jgi:hypothetical protein